jgi:hypothetical protein
MVALNFQTGDATTVGWMTKRDGWSITEDGRAALEKFSTPEPLYTELKRRYRDVDQQRKQAMQSLSDVQLFVADALHLVRAGTWTAHDDLAGLAGTTPNEVAHRRAGVEIHCHALDLAAEPAVLLRQVGELAEDIAAYARVGGGAG